MPKSSKIQITNLQNVFTISQKEEVREEVDFLNVDKHKLFLQVGEHQSLPQGDTTITAGYDQVFSNYPK